MGIVSKAAFSVKEFFFPLVNKPIGNMADLRASKAPVQAQPKPIGARSCTQQADDGSARPEKKASRPVPWATRFQLLVFAVRLRFSSGGSATQALKAEIEAFRTASTKDNLPGVVKDLNSMLEAANKKIAQSGPRETIPPALGPRYTGL